jgi:N-acetylneuraminic acid mutarotase
MTYSECQIGPAVSHWYLYCKHQILLYGGEYYDADADRTHVYGDLYSYAPQRNKWTRIVIPKGCGAKP